MFHRLIKLPKTQSFFLFGGRSTGKSTLLQRTLDPKNTHWISLLKSEEEHKFSLNPSLIRAELLGLPKHITCCVIDEVQKIPGLLNEVHYLIEDLKIPLRFALTGSSARKLKAGGANLLAGRAVWRSLFPLTPLEIAGTFDLQKYLSFGGLPEIWNLNEDSELKDYLRTYGSIYMKEEVWSTQLVRKLDPFRRFLEVAAQSSGKILNYTNISRDTGVDPKTIQSWFEVLEDTLLGYHLDAFDTSIRKQVRKSAKFYLFDTGVTRSLAGMLNVPPKESTSYYGDLFEQFIINQIFAINAYFQLDYKLSYLKTKENAEIDLVIQRPGEKLLCVEIKSRTTVDEVDLRKLYRFQNDLPDAEFILVSRDPVTKQFKNTKCLHFLDFFKGIMI